MLLQTKTVEKITNSGGCNTEQGFLTQDLVIDIKWQIYLKYQENNSSFIIIPFSFDTLKPIL